MSCSNLNDSMILWGHETGEMCSSQSFLRFAIHNPGIFRNSVYTPVTLLPLTGDYSPGLYLSWHVWVLDCLFITPHSFPGDSLWTLTVLISIVAETLGISPGGRAGLSWGKVAYKEVVYSCWSWLPWPSHRLFSTVWVWLNIKPWWECWHCWADPPQSLTWCFLLTHLCSRRQTRSHQALWCLPQTFKS